jgi:hypothetical protein
VGRRDLKDPQNPYTFKKYIAFNTFQWIDEGAGRRGAGRRRHRAAHRRVDRIRERDLARCRRTGSNAA